MKIPVDVKTNEEYGVVGGLEFYPQMFADMVRVGELLMYNALGIVGLHQVIGLLVVHGKEFGILTKYYINFLKGESKLYIGEETNTGFIFIVNLNNINGYFKI